MRTVLFKLPDGFVDTMEKLSYEVDGASRIIRQIVADNTNPAQVLEGETFKGFYQRYEERNAAYEIAKQELQDTYIPKEWTKNNYINKWNLDFKSGILTVEVTDDVKGDIPNEYKGE